MNKSAEYRLNASECRKLASKMEEGQDRELLLRMAEHWDQLASDRADLISRHPELAVVREKKPVKD
jgi:hypothetical protein